MLYTISTLFLHLEVERSQNIKKFKKFNGALRLLTKKISNFASSNKNNKNPSLPLANASLLLDQKQQKEIAFNEVQPKSQKETW